MVEDVQSTEGSDCSKKMDLDNEEIEKEEERKRPPEVASVKPPLRNEGTVIETAMAAKRIKNGSSTSHISTHQEESSNAGEDNRQAASSSVQQVRNDDTAKTAEAEEENIPGISPVP